MVTRITFRSEIFVEGKDLKEIKHKFENLPIYDIDIQDKGMYDYGFCEYISIEDVDNGYEDLINEYERV